jgi:hypothetical protein
MDFCERKISSLISDYILARLWLIVKLYVAKENFEFRSTRNGTRVITRGMADLQSVESHFDTNNLSYYSFYPKPEKPMKAVLRHLPHNTPAENTWRTGEPRFWRY